MPVKIRELGPGYISEVDRVDERKWDQLLQEFDDANIYQTWPFAAMTVGGQNMSHLVLKRNGEITAIAVARIAKLPFLKAGIAYVRWGPLWRCGRYEADTENFRQAIRALRNEYACRQGLVLRLVPALFDDDSPAFSAILREEGFSTCSEEIRSRTILLDLRPSLTELRQGLKRNWKRNLKFAEEGKLEITEGTGDELFAAFIEIYKEMVARKKFIEPNDINQFRLMQSRLPEQLKMQIMLCRSSGTDRPCAGLVWSALGKMGIELYAATSDAGMANGASYLLRWKLVEKLKQNGFLLYNLNGINPARNPGGYKFKSELAGNHGKDVYFLGRFDSYTNFLTHSFVEVADKLRTTYRALRGLTKAGHVANLTPKKAE